jgi:hypothetical protein
MQIRVLIFATLLVLSCALAGMAQGSAQCALKTARVPELRGLRLEMTVSQVKARYPKMPVGAADNLGQLRIDLFSNSLAEIDSAAFKGVDHLTLSFIDDRLIGFVVTYTQLPWKDIHQFTARMSEALKLPDGWSGDDSTQTLDCDGFQVRTGRVSYSSGGMSPYIGFKVLGAESIVRERIEKQKEQQLQTFKP